MILSLRFCRNAWMRGWLWEQGWDVTYKSAGDGLDTRMGTLSLATPLKKCFSFPQQLLTSYSSSERGRALWTAFPPPWQNVDMPNIVVCLLRVIKSVYFLLLSNPNTGAAARVKILPLQTEARLLCCPSIVLPSAYVDLLACPVFYPLCPYLHMWTRSWLHTWGRNVCSSQLGKLEWVALWKQSYRMTSLLPHPLGHLLSS